MTGSLEQLMNTFPAATTLSDALTAYDRIDTEDFSLGLVNNYYVRAQEKLNLTLRNSFYTLFGEESKKLNSDTDKAQVKSGIVDALKEYFAVISPSMIASMNTIGLSAEEQFEFLLKEYDQNIGGGKVERLPTMGALVNGLMSGKISTGQFQRELYNVQANYVNIAANLKKEALTSQIFGAYETKPYLLEARLVPEFERLGFEVEDKVGYM